MNTDNLPVINKEKCTLCGDCVNICPEDALHIVKQAVAFTDPMRCTFCTLCETICLPGAITCSFQITW